MTSDDEVWIPLDVVVWLAETYTAQGITKWCRAYRESDELHREHLIQIARSDGNG